MSSTKVTSGSTLDLSGIISYSTIEVQGTTVDTDLVLTNSATLNNFGTILLDGTDSRIYGSNGLANALDNVNGTIEGAGQIGINSGSNNVALINESAGTIDANSTQPLELLLGGLPVGSPPASNEGLIEATDTGGLLIEQSTIDNIGGTILASGTGDSVVLVGADLAGGVLTTTNGGLIETGAYPSYGASSNTLDGSTTPVTIASGSTIQVNYNGVLALDGTVEISANSVIELTNAGDLDLNGAIANFGSIIVASGANGFVTGIHVSGGDTATLSGGGVIELTGPNAFVLGTSNTPATLDNVSNTIEGAGQIGTNSTADQLALINEAGGTIDANRTGGMTIALGGPTLSNLGLIETGLAGAALTIDSPVSGTGTLQIGTGTEISLNSTVASGQTIDFIGSPDVLGISQALSMDGVIDGFGPQDRIYLPNVPFNSGADVLNYNNNTLAIENSGTTLASFDLPGTYVTNNFTLTSDTKGGSDLTTNVMPCFAAGTRIATERGEIPVEELRVGDEALTTGGAVRPVVWIGHRRTDCRRHPRPDLVWPVRVRAGAFGQAQPKRDLLLSPDHALWLPGAGDGAPNVLIPVKYLINGATIVQETVAEVHYFHVELAGHDILFAEGLPAESYLDTGNRAQFENGAAHCTLHPNFSPMSWEDACATLCLDGPAISAERERLMARAHQLGYSIVTGSDLHVLAGGRVTRAAAVKGKLQQFLLPPNIEEIRVVSRAGVPAGFDLAAEDRRRFGVRIGAVSLGNAAIPLDSPLFADGFHRIERKGRERWRWTDGDARLVLPEALAAPALLELLVRDTMRSWQPPSVAPKELAVMPERALTRRRRRR